MLRVHTLLSVLGHAHNHVHLLRHGAFYTPKKECQKSKSRMTKVGIVQLITRLPHVQVVGQWKESYDH